MNKSGLKLLFLIGNIICLNVNIDAQTFHVAPPYGKYVTDSISGRKAIEIIKGPDTNRIFVITNNIKTAYLIIDDSTFVSVDSTVVLSYLYPMWIKSSDVIYFRQTGFDLNGKQILKTRYSVTNEKSVYELRKMKWKNGRHVIKTRLKNGKYHGINSDRMGLKYCRYQHFRDGVLNGLVTHNSPLWKGKMWFHNGKVVFGSCKHIHPTNRYLKEYQNSYNW